MPKRRKPEEESAISEPKPDAKSVAEVAATLWSHPGYPQCQVVAAVAELPITLENLGAIAKGIAENRKTGKSDDVQILLHSQISTLNALAAKFMMKSLAAIDNPYLINKAPNMAAQLADISLKCQAEMRRCLALLVELQNPRKSNQHVAQVIVQQINSLQLEQEELRQQLEEATHATMDTRSQIEAIPENQRVETLVEIDGSENL